MTGLFKFSNIKDRLDAVYDIVSVPWSTINASKS
jgi:hypothetical protein